MSGSSTGSADLTYSSLEDELPIATVPIESSSVQGINIKESPGEGGKQVSSMVGWIVYKKYGIHAVKGVVQSYKSETKIYEVQYKDGKSEKVTGDNLIRYLSPCSPENETQRQKSKPAIINAQNAGRMHPARKATKRTSGGTEAAQQSRQVSQGSGEVPAANSSNEVPARKAAKRARAGTAAAQQSRQVSQGSEEVLPANSINEGKSRYRSLRMNAGR